MRAEANASSRASFSNLNIMKLASIQIISEIRPIDGADRIEAATVLGTATR
jgi:hypothetical protein